MKSTLILLLAERAAAYTFGIAHTCNTPLTDGGFNEMAIAGADAVVAAHGGVSYVTTEVCDNQAIVNATIEHGVQHWLGIGVSAHARARARAAVARRE